MVFSTIISASSEFKNGKLDINALNSFSIFFI
jgi:hypothetical protein